MILQCDQCNTKFRLDDSKLKPGGVKVRCSKCRHVFVAGAQPKPEESDFDALLSGLGAPAPAQPQAEGTLSPASGQPAAAAEPATEAASAKTSTSGFGEFADFDFTPEPASSQAPAAPAGTDAGSAFDFSTPEPAAAPEPQAADASGGLDFGDFAFNEEPPALKEEPAAGGGFDGGEFDFSPGPLEENAGQQPAAPASDLAFGEFEFNDSEPIQRQESAASELDFGELAFNEEPAVKAEAPAEEFDFEDFSFSEEPAAPAEAQAATKGDFDFGDFSFTEEPASKPETPAAKEEFDFGDFSAPQEPAVHPEEPAAAKDEFDFGDFSFSEPPAAQAEEPAAAKGEFDFSDFSFSEEPPPLKEEAPAAENFDDFFNAAPPPKSKEEAAPKEDLFTDGFSLGEEKEPAPAASPLLAGIAATAAGLAKKGAAGELNSEESVPLVAPAAEPKPAAPTTNLDFSFGPKPGMAGEEGEEEEELPPLSITSRRKGRSVLSVALVAIAVVVVVAVTGAGLYLLQSGPAAMATFDKVGLGFVGKWFGIEAPDEGKITVNRPAASFYQNKEAGELFVVTGQAVNNFKKARASIHVKVAIFDKKGAVIMQKTAYCGNKLSKDQLETLPMAKIDQIMNNQFGDSLSNLGVKPGQSIGFVVALANVPKDAADFGVEVVGSTVAGQ
ncbi:MAG TPA: DUF3426 domain-containing protein [Geomonas sp.]|nr:DUF3426 domain-containing protein [Geomonas sp.]